MIALAFGCGFAAGAVTLAIVRRVLRHEIALYGRARGHTIDLTHLSREDSRS